MEININYLVLGQSIISILIGFPLALSYMFRNKKIAHKIGTFLKIKTHKIDYSLIFLIGLSLLFHSIWSVYFLFRYFTGHLILTLNLIIVNGLVLLLMIIFLGKLLYNILNTKRK